MAAAAVILSPLVLLRGSSTEPNQSTTVNADAKPPRLDGESQEVVDDAVGDTERENVTGPGDYGNPVQTVDAVTVTGSNLIGNTGTATLVENGISTNQEVFVQMDQNDEVVEWSHEPVYEATSTPITPGNTPIPGNNNNATNSPNYPGNTSSPAADPSVSTPNGPTILDTPAAQPLPTSTAGTPIDEPVGPAVLPGRPIDAPTLPTSTPPITVQESSDSDSPGFPIEETSPADNVYAINDTPGMEGVSTEINEGKQGIHQPGHNNYIPGRSTINEDVDPQELLDGAHSGEYEVVGTSNRGDPVVDFGEPIGVDYLTGEATQYGTIHSGENGAHISSRQSKYY